MNELISMLSDVFLDSLIDSIKVLPFLFLTYLLMELLEHHAEDKTEEMIKKAGKTGPIWGAVLGVLPQCGFSAAASGFYAGGLISVGTLIAVFLSTSDEMLPIFVSQRVAGGLIGKILLLKVLAGLITGLFLDFILSKYGKGEFHPEIHELCEEEKCHCDERSLMGSAAYHAIQITGFLFVISCLLGILIECVGEETLGGLFLNTPLIGEMIAALVGLIPNCAASVVITQLYVEGILNGAAMMSGLFVSAGMGLLVLFRSSRHMANNLKVLGMLYASGVFWGLVIHVTGILV